jgi:hypothetical protein
MPLKIENLIHRNLTPSEAQILLSRCETEILDVSMRSLTSAWIIASLCKQGLDKEAWNLITLDSGHVRSSEIGFYFTFNKSTTPADLMKMITEMPDSSDREHAISGLIQGRPEVALKMDASLFPGKTADGKHMFMQSIAEVIKKNDTPQNIKDEFIQRSIHLTASGNLETGYLSLILESALPRDSFAQWDLILEHRGTFDKKKLESFQAGMVKSMIDTNLAKTMDMLVSTAETKYSYPVLSAAVTRMFTNSPAEANTWVSNNLDSIDPATSQRIISCLAQVANQNLEFETSRKWANRILNAEVRQQLLEQVDKRETEKTK